MRRLSHTSNPKHHSTEAKPTCFNLSPYETSCTSSKYDLSSDFLSFSIELNVFLHLSFFKCNERHVYFWLLSCWVSAFWTVLIVKLTICYQGKHSKQLVSLCLCLAVILESDVWWSSAHNEKWNGLGRDFQTQSSGTTHLISSCLPGSGVFSHQRRMEMLHALFSFILICLMLNVSRAGE